MPSCLTGDFLGLAEVIGELEGLRDMTDDIAIESSVEIESAIDSQFTLGVDPYGSPWAPLAESTKRRHGRDDPALTATGAMRDSVVVQATQGSIEVIIADPAGYHQDGTDNMPARKIIPDDGRAMPDAWAAAIREGAGRAIDRAFDSGRFDGHADIEVES